MITMTGMILMSLISNMTNRMIVVDASFPGKIVSSKNGVEISGENATETNNPPVDRVFIWCYN